MLVYINLIFAVIDFIMMALCISQGRGVWLICLVSGCICLFLGIWNVVLDIKIKAYNAELKKIAEDRAEAMKRFLR